ncbi:MAG: helix-turn-helix transcriptional regulator [Bacteroidetes bacterium]|nr:helix-turn-helix transcriptional regulator [Bacteroidota bacterium]
MESDLEKIEKKYLEKLMNRIINLRKEHGISQEKLAIESDVARSLMRGYERHERNISFANLIRIIKLGLKMSVEDFFSEGFDNQNKSNLKVDDINHELTRTVKSKKSPKKKIKSKK